MERIEPRNALGSVDVFSQGYETTIVLSRLRMFQELKMEQRHANATMKGVRSQNFQLYQYFWCIIGEDSVCLQEELQTGVPCDYSDWSPMLHVQIQIFILLSAKEILQGLWHVNLNTCVTAPCWKKHRKTQCFLRVC